MPDEISSDRSLAPAYEELPEPRSERYAYPCALSLPRERGGRWTAEVPDLLDCRSEGDGAAECIANIVDAVEAWVSSALQRGEALPAPTSIDARVREPAFHKAVWLLVIRRDKPDDLTESKALADVGALPTIEALADEHIGEAQPTAATPEVGQKAKLRQSQP